MLRPKKQLFNQQQLLRQERSLRGNEQGDCGEFVKSNTLSVEYRLCKKSHRGVQDIHGFDSESRLSRNKGGIAIIVAEPQVPVACDCGLSW